MRIPTGVVAALTIPLLSACASATAVRPPPSHSVSVISDGLRPAWSLLMRESTSFRQAIRAAEADGFRIVIGYQEDFDPPYPDPTYGAVATVGPLFDADGRYAGVHVVFYTREIEDRAESFGVARDTITRELAIVLAHEVYGHVATSVAGRQYPFPCADPVWAEAPAEPGCAVIRENMIRSEIGFPLRPRYLFIDLSFYCVVRADMCAQLNALGERGRHN